MSCQNLQIQSFITPIAKHLQHRWHPFQLQVLCNIQHRWHWACYRLVQHRKKWTWEAKSRSKSCKGKWVVNERTWPSVSNCSPSWPICLPELGFLDTAEVTWSLYRPLLRNITNPISVLCPSLHTERWGSRGFKASKLFRCFPSKLFWGLTKTGRAYIT